MLLRNVKIKVKLFFSFLIVIMFVVCISGVSVWQLYDVRKASADVYETNVRPMMSLEKFKSEFTELRRVVTAFATNASAGREVLPNSSFESVRKRYNSALSAFNAHILYLSEIKASSKNIADANALLGELKSEYWVNVEDIETAALNGDLEAMFSAMVKAAPSSSFITETINRYFEEKISDVAHTSEEVQKTSLGAIIIIIAASTCATIFSLILAFAMGGSISRRIAVLREFSKNIAEGKLEEVPESNYNDEIGCLSNDLGAISSLLRLVIDSIDVRIDRFDRLGDASSSIDTTSMSGSYKAIAESVDHAIKSMVEDVLRFVGCVSEYGHGNFKANMPRLPGDKAQMNEAADGVRSRLTDVSESINHLAESAAAGILDKRIDASQYVGGWGKIMVSLNRLMDAVSEPITEINETLEQVSTGVFDVKINGDYRGEFLQVKKSVNKMVSNIASYINEISQVLDALSHNNLDQGITREYVGKFSKIKDALNNIIHTLNRVIYDISNTSTHVSAGAKQISDSSLMLAQGATEQAMAIEELNATMHTINDSTDQNAANARTADELTKRSMSNAAKCSEEMEHMLVAIEGIKESSNNIFNINKVIEDIAFQTNLLALNAAVEAAHAGVKGQGFTVVAEEVRNLAARSQKAAKETAQLIAESIERVNQGTKMADITALALQTIVEDVTQVAGIVTDISNASGDQAVAIKQVMDGLSQITNVVQTNSATSQEAAAAAQQFTGQAATMQSLVDEFRIKRSI